MSIPVLDHITNSYINLRYFHFSYDIRDRARLLKHLVFDENSLNPEKVLLAAKPAPLGSGSASGVNSRFRRGTLSDALGIQTKNYQVD